MRRGVGINPLIATHDLNILSRQIQHLYQMASNLADRATGAVAGHPNNCEQFTRFNVIGILFQAWRLSEETKHQLGLSRLPWVAEPLLKIGFKVDRKPKKSGSP